MSGKCSTGSELEQAHISWSEAQLRLVRRDTRSFERPGTYLFVGFIRADCFNQGRVGRIARILYTVLYGSGRRCENNDLWLLIFHGFHLLFLEIFGPASRNFGRKAALAERSYAGRCKEMIVHINSYGPQPIRLRLGVGAVGFRAPVRSMV